MIYDTDRKLYRMWFASCGPDVQAQDGRTRETWQARYAESEDGISWDFHPVPLTHTGLGPCVLRDEDGGCRMWLNA